MESFKRFLTTQNPNADYSDINLFKIDESFSNNMFMPANLEAPSEDLCLPFEKCFITFNKSYAYQELKSNLSFTVDSFYCIENGPECIELLSLVRKFDGMLETYEGIIFRIKNGKYGLDRKFISLLDTEEGNHLFKAICNIANKVLTKLNSRKFIYTENDEKIDIKTRDKATRKLHRVKIKPRAIIYISDKKTFNREHPELSHKVISKPDYSWEVMGHYRKLHNPNSLGKNRKGEYMVEGFTWVVPYVKGEGELLKKVRVVK